MEGYQVNMLVDTDGLSFHFAFSCDRDEKNVRFSFQGKVREKERGLDKYMKMTQYHNKDDEIFFLRNIQIRMNFGG